MESEIQQVNLKNRVVGQIELPSLNVKQYIGKKAKIELITEYEGRYGYFIKVETNVLDTIERKDKKDIKLRGSRVFGLQQDEDGNLGWGAETKLGLFLRKMKVKHYRDLIGIPVTIQTQTNKDGRDFLTFN